jgi:hypothetical protein
MASPPILSTFTMVMKAMDVVSNPFQQHVWLRRHNTTIIFTTIEH